MEEYASSWLLNEIQSVNSSQAVVITRVLWEVWFFRNKKVWENKVVTSAVAMEWSAKVISEWRDARNKHVTPISTTLTSSLQTPI